MSKYRDLPKITNFSNTRITPNAKNTSIPAFACQIRGTNDEQWWMEKINKLIIER